MLTARRDSDPGAGAGDDDLLASGVRSEEAVKPSRKKGKNHIHKQQLQK